MLNKLFLKIYGNSRFIEKNKFLIINNSNSLLNKEIIINTKDLSKMTFVIEKEIQNNQEVYNLFLNYFENNENGLQKAFLLGSFEEEEQAIEEKNKIVASFYSRVGSVVKTFSILIGAFLVFVLLNSIVFVNNKINTVKNLSPNNNSSFSSNSLGTQRKIPKIEDIDIAIEQIKAQKELYLSQGQNPDVMINQLERLKELIKTQQGAIADLNQTTQSQQSTPEYNNPIISAPTTSESQETLNRLGN